MIKVYKYLRTTYIHNLNAAAACTRCTIPVLDQRQESVIETQWDSETRQQAAPQEVTLHNQSQAVLQVLQLRVLYTANDFRPLVDPGTKVSWPKSFLFTNLIFSSTNTRACIWKMR